MAAALLSLVGCGLKGPLYFPPEKQPAKPQQQTAKQPESARNGAQTQGAMQPTGSAQPETESSTGSQASQ